jgi:hypothetical protein
MPYGSYRVGANITQALLGGAHPDPHDPALPRSYFQQLFETVDTDRVQIQKLRERLDYPEVSRRFRMIDEGTESVVVTQYGFEEEQHMASAMLDQLRRREGNSRLLLRRLQPWVVSIFRS